MQIKSKQDCRAFDAAVQERIEAERALYDPSAEERVEGDRLYEPGPAINRAAHRRLVGELSKKYPRHTIKRKAEVQGTLRAWLWIDAKKKGII